MFDMDLIKMKVDRFFFLLGPKFVFNFNLKGHCL